MASLGGGSIGRSGGGGGLGGGGGCSAGENFTMEGGKDIAGLIMGIASSAYGAAAGLDFTFDMPTFDMPNIDIGGVGGGGDVDIGAPPSYSPQSMPNLPALTVPEPIPPPALLAVDVPGFDVQVPTLAFPDTPAWIDYAAPTEPSVAGPTPPTPPALTYPTPPNLADIPIPDPPGLNIPVFDKTLLDEELIEPTNTFHYNEPQYTSLVKELLDNGLYDMIANSNYGLDALDEQRLWDRARERELLGMMLQSEDTFRPYSLSGFPMPPGTLLRAREAANQDIANKVSSFNRELLIKEADLHWEGKKFSYTQAIEWEKTLMAFHNAFYERMLNAAKAEVQVAIEIFRARIDRYKAQQERFLAQVEVYKAQVQAELTKIEIYKAQIDGARLAVDVGKARVDVYTAQLEAIKTRVSVYATEVEAAKAVMELERLKIDVYKGQIEAFVAKVQSEAAKFEAYKAGVQAEVSKVDIYTAQAKAYESIVAGRRLAVEMNSALIEQFKSRNQVLIDLFNAQVAGQQATRQAALAGIQANADGYRAQVAGYEAHGSVVVKAADVQGRWAETVYRCQMAGQEVAIAAARLALEAAKAQAEIAIQAMQVRGQVYAALASSALSAMNLNTSMSQSANYSCNESWSNSVGYSLSDSWSDSRSTNSNESFNLNASTEVVQYHYYEE